MAFQTKQHWGARSPGRNELRENREEGMAGNTTKSILLTIHRLDPEDTISFVDAEWIAFAHANWDRTLKIDKILGRSLWDFIQDSATIDLWKLVLARVREGQFFLRIPYRCDSPDLRRFMEMGIAPYPDGSIETHNRILREEPREPDPILDAHAPRSGETLCICSLCKRVLDPKGLTEPSTADGSRQSWVEIEELSNRSQLLDQASFPRLTHTVCPACTDHVTRSLDAGGSREPAKQR
ncbi:MAG: hypothetical protein AB9873_14380 [Syntrophobacteraceae bacterium]